MVAQTSCSNYAGAIWPPLVCSDGWKLIACAFLSCSGYMHAHVPMHAHGLRALGTSDEEGQLMYIL